MCGIYKIENQVTHECYIGQSVDIERRWRHHKNPNRWSCGTSLYKAFSEYGIDAFAFSVVEECDKSVLDLREKYWISYYDSHANGYNETIGGMGSAHSVKLLDEDVAEIIRLLQETDVSQNEIAELFSVGIDTISEINNGKTRILQGVVYPIRQWGIRGYDKVKRTTCPKCGGKKIANAKLCRKCTHAKQRKVVRPTKSVLAQDLEHMTFVDTGAKYGVSGNAVVQWCKAYGLSYRKRDMKANA